MSFSAWLSLLSVCLLGAMSPGPSLAVVAKNTLGGGKINGLLTAWSHALGIGFYAVMTLLGLAIVLKENPNLFHVITYAGACYLLWLAFNAFRSQGGVAEKFNAKQKTSYWQAMHNGLMISLLNPKIGLFFLALFSQFIDSTQGVTGKIAVVLTPTLVDGLWYSLIVFLVSHPKVLAVIRDKAIWIDRLTGLVLLLLAINIFWKL